MERMQLDLPDPDATRALGRALGAALEPGLVVAHPARSDWAEGMRDVNGSGANWCRRQALGVAWGMPGASLMSNSGA